MIPSNKGKSLTSDQLTFLKTLGLEITPHSDPTYGWGFIWHDRSWDGPYPTPFDAVQAAFEDAGRAMRARSDAPFPSHDGYMVRWNEQQQDWEAVKFEDGKLWRFTGIETHQGWEVLLPSN
jgi:hypothetical protein